jgi:hypothetical protein
MANDLRCPCCRGYMTAEDWNEALGWLRVMGIEVDIDGTLDTISAARFLGKSEQTLRNRRAMGEPPEYTKDASGHVRYHMDELSAWRERNEASLHELGVDTGRRVRTKKYDDD